MSVNISDFSYVLCPGSMPEPRHHETYNKIYNCWSSVWTQAFKELGEDHQLKSDAFTRQDYVGAVFYKDSCVALSFFRWTQSHSPHFASDSYFANWSEEHLRKLTSRGPNIIVCSNFTVHPDARGTKLVIPGKDLLMGMIVETYMNARADGMTGAVRVNRKVNDAGFRWGALEIDRDIDSGHGDTVDLIGFFKDHISNYPAPEWSSFCHQLWAKRIIIPRYSFQNEFSDIQDLHINSFVAA